MTVSTSASGSLPSYRWILVREAAAFDMSSKIVAQAIDRLTQEGLHLLGSSDDSALFDFVEEYLCGDDPDDNEDEHSSGTHAC